MSSSGENTALFRPVGLIEMGLIFDSGMRAFPPRLPEQPIFYPVLNQAYARQITKGWNADSAQSGFAGFVTKFDLSANYLAKFPVKTVGSGMHRELWVAAEELDEFNARIIGHIEVLEVYCGKGFVGFIPDKFGLKGKNATEQFLCLAAVLNYSGMDFICETTANAKAVYLNYPFWTASDFTALGLSDANKQQVLKAIRMLWVERFPSAPLCEIAV